MLPTTPSGENVFRTSLSSMHNQNSFSTSALGIPNHYTAIKQQNENNTKALWQQLTGMLS